MIRDWAGVTEQLTMKDETGVTYGIRHGRENGQIKMFISSTSTIIQVSLWWFSRIFVAPSPR